MSVLHGESLPVHLKPHFVADQRKDRKQFDICVFDRVFRRVVHPLPEGTSVVSVVHAYRQTGVLAEELVLVCCRYVEPVIGRETVVVLFTVENRATVGRQKVITELWWLR